MEIFYNIYDIIEESLTLSLSYFIDTKKRVMGVAIYIYIYIV